MKHICVFGGAYGSEGKGSLAEWLAVNSCNRRAKDGEGRKLIVAGENSPNSGHTCTLGKTRNIPASSFYADAVILGPDTVIDAGALADDVSAICNGHMIPVYIHRHAAMVQPVDKLAESVKGGVVERVSSTGTGSGHARVRKCFHRQPEATIGFRYPNQDNLEDTMAFKRLPIYLLNHYQWIDLLRQHYLDDWIFECSQGTMLDVNWGRFPYVTSRTTLPRVAIERNGLGGLAWEYAGVYRTYPIRTGGPSGPTGGKEIKFADIGVAEEIASVTKRIRRVFEFDANEFILSLKLNRPSTVAFTHLDYLPKVTNNKAFLKWLEDQGVTKDVMMECGVSELLVSGKLGTFLNVELR